MMGACKLSGSSAVSLAVLYSLLDLKVLIRQAIKEAMT
jgi:hypothetical protein